jgi:mitogen-activated protein kinase kinase kinase
MVRVTNYFDTQVQVPTAKDGREPRPRRQTHKLNDSKTPFETHIESASNEQMTNEQMISWYGKILDSVRLRYRKLQRFAR